MSVRAPSLSRFGSPPAASICHTADLPIFHHVVGFRVIIKMARDVDYRHSISMVNHKGHQVIGFHHLWGGGRRHVVKKMETPSDSDSVAVFR